MNKNKLNILWLILLLFNLLERAYLIKVFNLPFTDGDQTIMWNGALEFMKGNFHEPFWFGQKYNTMLESLLAIPFIKMGLSFQLSLPLVTNLLITVSFLLISIHFLLNRKIQTAIVFLSVPLLLPIEFAMITSIPRGFVTGVFLASIGIFLYLRNTKGKFFLLSFFSFLSLIANPNAIVLTFPFAATVLYSHYTKKEFYLSSLLGSVVPLSLWGLALYFYEVNPEYVVYRAWELNFDMGRIRPSTWASLFGDVTPLFWNTKFGLIGIIVGILFFAVKRRMGKTIVFIVSLILILVISLSFNRIYYGGDSVFFSKSRMFIAIPLTIALLISIIDMRKKVTIALSCISLFFFGFKLYSMQRVSQENFQAHTNQYVRSAEVEELKAKCELLAKMVEEINANAVLVYNANPYRHLINYGCPCLEEELPPMIETVFDRRTWKIRELSQKKFNNVLIIGLNDFDKHLEKAERFKYVLFNNELKGIGIINNQLMIEQLAISFKVPLRPH